MPDKGITLSRMEPFFWVLLLVLLQLLGWKMDGWMGGRTYKRWWIGLSLARMTGILEGKGILYWVVLVPAS